MKQRVEQAPTGGASFTKTSWLGFTLLILVVQLWMLHKTLQMPSSPQDLTRAHLPSLRPGTFENDKAAVRAAFAASAAAAAKQVAIEEAAARSDRAKKDEMTTAIGLPVPTVTTETTIVATTPVVAATASAAAVAVEKNEDVTPAITPTAIAQSEEATLRSSGAVESEGVVSDRASTSEEVAPNDGVKDTEAPSPSTADSEDTEAPSPSVVDSKETAAPSPSTADSEQSAETSSPTDDEDADSTPLDAALLDKYSEECVELGDHHLEGLFIKPGICVSRRQVQQILIDLVVVTSRVFTEHNITHFLESGTLLGSYRHKSVIPFDVDSDMGIDADGYDKIKATPIQFPPEYHLQVHDTNVHPQVSRYIELPVRVVHRETALYMDVFVYNDSVDDDGKEWTGPIPSNCYINCEKCPRVADEDRWELKIPREWIYPLQDCRFAKHTFKCPAETEKYLEYMFGANYMDPVPFY
ncbi:hypothetical protein PybrP1_007391 [[Pythium] brassicae (nom. inval.)]|nr:hypothetical protein PybrP1_007391 [[Pythium] brassicae (nom. inval.)]